MALDIEYSQPETINEAISVLSERSEDATVMSGGQSLLPELRQQPEEYNAVVDLNNIEGFDYIEKRDRQIRIGFLTRYADILSSELVHNHCEVLSEVVESIGDVQVRNRGTLCGGISQADPAGDPPVIAYALEAEIGIKGEQGVSTYDATSLFVEPYETVLSETEIVTEVRFPVVNTAQGIAYKRYTGASDQAYPVATVAAIITLTGDGIIDQARIVTGVVESQPVSMDEVAERLEGRNPTDDLIANIARTVGEQTEPIAGPDGTKEFKSEIIKTLTKDALDTAIDKATKKANERI